jgi:hypothetical protein
LLSKERSCSLGSFHLCCPAKGRRPFSYNAPLSGVANSRSEALVRAERNKRRYITPFILWHSWAASVNAAPLRSYLPEDPEVLIFATYLSMVGVDPQWIPLLGTPGFLMLNCKNASRGNPVLGR